MVSKVAIPANHHDWDGVSMPTFHEDPVSLQVRGEWACFTRPEFNSERVSYSVMTPTAAVGLLSSVFWKPQFRWVVQAIDVLAPVKWATFRRNEVDGPITRDLAAMGYLDANAKTQQRMTLLLRDVHYRVHAQVWVHPEAQEKNPAKWRDQFRRRLARGQSFRTPFLGIREFHADVEAADQTPCVDWTEDLGTMLHSIHATPTGTERYEWFEAKVEGGRMTVPPRGVSAKSGDQR